MENTDIMTEWANADIPTYPKELYAVPNDGLIIIIVIIFIVGIFLCFVLIFGIYVRRILLKLDEEHRSVATNSNV